MMMMKKKKKKEEEEEKMVGVLRVASEGADGEEKRRQYAHDTGDAEVSGNQRAAALQ
jgi:hypothetical protein